MHVVFSDAVVRWLHVFAPAHGKAADALAGNSARIARGCVSGVSEHSAIDRMETCRGRITDTSDRMAVTFDSGIAVFHPVHHRTTAVTLVQSDRAHHFAVSVVRPVERWIAGGAIVISDSVRAADADFDSGKQLVGRLLRVYGAVCGVRHATVASAAELQATCRTSTTCGPEVPACDYRHIHRVVPAGNGRFDDAAGRNERGLSGRRCDSIPLGDSAFAVPVVLYPVFRK